MSSSKVVNIYTDGSCINNGSPNATASLGVWVEGHPEKCLSERIESGPQTNQVAELRALGRALDISSDFEEINIHTDSRYAMNCITLWCRTWEKNGWKSSRGKHPTNMELIKEVITKLRRLQSDELVISFTYVPGHSGHEGNEAAHALAMSASRFS